MNTWQKICANVVLVFLQSTVKNPKSLEKEGMILDQIRDLIDQIRPRSN